jgi:hypothetical protein
MVAINATPRATRIEGPTPLDAKLLDLLLKTHRRDAGEAGYRRALADLQTAAVLLAEKALCDATSPDARIAVYRLIELIESEVKRLREDETFSEGAGI